LNKYLLEFNGITCPGCITAVENEIKNLNDTQLLRIDKTTGKSILKSDLKKTDISESLKSCEGCCSSCQISLGAINSFSGDENQIQLGGEDEFLLIKKQYSHALDKIKAKEEVACSEYCVCKTTDVDRFAEFSEAPSFSSIFNLVEYLTKFNYLNSGLSVLDFGCGTGHDSFQIAPLVAPGIVTGIDITPDMVSFAKETKKKLDIANVVFHQSAYLQLIKPETQDIILTNNVFNLLPDKSTFLQQAAMTLKANGTLVIADEFTIDALPDSLRKDPAFQCGGIADAQRMTSIIKLCEDNGFKVQQREIIRNYEISFNDLPYKLESALLFFKKS
jgi:2-polyprenyl-3-methyl-5-hydroxy-6-metoxy-1,4-benzoquinol methylase